MEVLPPNTERFTVTFCCAITVAHQRPLLFASVFLKIMYYPANITEKSPSWHGQSWLNQPWLPGAEAVEVDEICFNSAISACCSCMQWQQAMALTLQMEVPWARRMEQPVVEV